MKPNCDTPPATTTTSRPNGLCGEVLPGAATNNNGSSLESEIELRRGLEVIQSMIDISADRLEGLRTQCVTSAELTQQEMRSLETKLVRMFTEMLLTKERLPERPHKALACSSTATAELKQWLRVVGLSAATFNAILHRVGTLEILLEKSEAELKALLPLSAGNCDEEDARRLTRAMTSLRRCQQASRKKEACSDLFWDSWDSRQSHKSSSHHHHHHQHHHSHNPHSKGVSASPRATRSHRHHNYYQQQQQQVVKVSTNSSTSTPSASTGGVTLSSNNSNSTTMVDGSHSGVQSPIETSPPESYNNSQSSTTSAAVQSPAEESSTMSTNLTPSPSPPMSPLSLQQQQQHQQQQHHNSSPMTSHSPLGVTGIRGPATTGRTTNPVQSSTNSLTGEKYPSTPPPRIKHQTTLTNDSGAPPTSGSALPQPVPPTQWGSGTSVVITSGQQQIQQQQQQVIMTKSRSHESQLITNEGQSGTGNDPASGGGSGETTTNNTTKSGNGGGNNSSISNGGTLTMNNSSNNSGMKTPRSRLHTEPGPDPVNDLFSDKPSPVSSHNLVVPRSPLTPNSVISSSGTHNNHHHHHNQHHHQHSHHSGSLPRETQPPNANSSGNQVAATLNHDIPHHFTKNFKLTTVTCNFCNRQMFYGLKCKECKYRCHKECEPQVPPSCGLPQQVFDMINSSPNMNRTGTGGGGNSLGSGSHHSRRGNHQEILLGKGGSNTLIMTGGGSSGATLDGTRTIGGGGPDSSSAGSSCNSSSPSSPALLLSSSSGHNNNNHYYGSQFQHHPQTPQQGYMGHHKSQFSFPEVATVVNAEDATGNTTTTTLYKNSEMVNSNISVLSDYRAPNSPRITFTADEESSEGDQAGGQGSSGHYYNGGGGQMDGDSMQSPLLTSSASGGGGNESIVHQNVSQVMREGAEMTQEEKTGSTMSGSSTNTGGSSTDSERTPIRLDSTEERDSMAWPRQNSLSLKEWDIPYDDLRLLEQLGKGRFGTVHRALWHGDVAVKLLKEDYLDDERTLEAFKLEVAIFKKTRHENVVLFMGACMKPPRLAIVTSLCKGKTLFTHIYVCRDKFNLNKATMVAQQISQGMGYLHARGIVHKDLKTKNIFLENGKVIITDFGLFSATKLQYCDRGVEVQENWLCYLAPELIRGLQPIRATDEDLSFSRASDVYAFGTVWYELLCGEFPFKKVPAESVIWQVGRGMKPTLANLQASRDVKDILMLCWAFQADDRKDFATLLGLLERLPKKRLARSPSHPVQLSKSAESVF